MNTYKTQIDIVIAQFKVISVRVVILAPEISKALSLRDTLSDKLTELLEGRECLQSFMVSSIALSEAYSMMEDNRTLVFGCLERDPSPELMFCRERSLYDGRRLFVFEGKSGRMMALTPPGLNWSIEACKDC